MNEQAQSTTQERARSETQGQEAHLVTEDYRLAPSGIGPHANTWADKPHRLIYDLCNEVQRLQALLSKR